jgi:hypothetical protein
LYTIAVKSRPRGGFSFCDFDDTFPKPRADKDRMRTSFLIVLCLLVAGAAPAQEGNRIKRKPPTPAEAEQQAADMAVNDSLLRQGDIVVTGRGFVRFRGLAADGVTGQFEPVPNPLLAGKK